MSTAQLRRSQAIAPFGPGAIHILKGGMAVVTAGLDYWYRESHDQNASASNEQLAAIRLQEPRLQASLGVTHFRIPPGPECALPGQPILAVPLFRFPTWFTCPRCGLMLRVGLGTGGMLHCQNKSCVKEPLQQVRFAAVCDHGHLQDFPWMEWVHREPAPACQGTLTYRAGGAGSLDDIRISCSCGKGRSLAGVMSGRFDDPENPAPDKRTGWSALSRRLASKADPEPGSDAAGDSVSSVFPCQGGKVWLGCPTGETCARPLRAVLINATNVHYARVASALWIPADGEPSTLKTLKSLMEAVEARSYIRLCRSTDDTPQVIAVKLKKKWPDRFGTFTADLVEQILKVHLGLEAPAQPTGTIQLDGDLGLRWPEYAQLSRKHETDDGSARLVVRMVDVNKLPDWLSAKVESVSLLDRLMETRVFAGFTRLMPAAPEGAPGAQTMLWNEMPDSEHRWLPGLQVYGEGLFIRFKEAPLRKWETVEAVNARIEPLRERYEQALQRTKRLREEVSPRRIMLHTLAHLLIRRLVFSCGYGSAALRERLYISSDAAHPMAGILIYTASGDCEGSLGGLVRMGEPENLAAIFAAALEDARWCSSDPVCSESGQQGGQGNDGLNIAACHSCALLPETSCELFNALLDRSLVIGSSSGDQVPFFGSGLS